ncbi:MAG TPA: putative LPS assembly protein LptD [Bacteroidales bacterium]|nr:putative LPS assembly protein LptD [Bacteroidales bacterium]
MTLFRRLPTSIWVGFLLLTCCLLWPLSPVGGQVNVPTSDALQQADTLILADTVAVADSTADTLAVKKKDAINEIVRYESTDSLVFFGAGVAQLYGAAKVQYGDLNLDAGFIRMDVDSSLMTAVGRKDSSNAVIEKPVFKDKSGEYKADEIKYNFKSGKGMISQVVTQQGEGYVVSGQTKRVTPEELCMIDGKYTTCENHDHPHFYLALSKAKVRPGEYIVSGPAHLVMEDVHLPLFIPFGYFPFTSKYSSGILTPSYGDELSRGFYLKDGGYYFAFSDYVDLALTGEVYSKGSWGLRARSAYRVRYKYSGSFNLSFLETVTSEKSLPDYAKTKNFSLTWSHAQDAKANPNRSFSASVNFATSGYSRSDLNSYYNPQAFSNNTKSSSVSFSQRFPESPFSMSMSANVSQRSRDSVLTVSLPSLRVSMSTISPFARKNAVGSERWYEKIRVGYSASFSNSISEVKERDFLKKNIIKDWRNGIQHSIPVSATFSVLNYINITPSFSYTERWYSSSLDKHYDYERNEVLTDTTWGFNRVWDASGSVSASTKLYGYYQPLQSIFGDKISTIRHVITPTVSLSYRPDYGREWFGYYDEVSYVDPAGKTQVLEYSRYSNGLYGTPGRGESGSVNFSVTNNLEMKVKQETDTSTVFKKISLIDNFSFGSGYNMAADSLNWSDISANIRIKFGTLYTLNLSGSFDPYTYELNASGNPVKVNTTQWSKNRIPGKLTGTGTSFSYTINNQTFKKKEKKETEDSSVDASVDSESSETDAEAKALVYDPEASLYQPLKIPWSINMSYSLRYSRSTFNKEKMDFDYRLTQNMSLSGNIALTDKWRFNASTSYNFQYKEFSTMNCSVTRDLHCWEMSASFIPIGRYKSYNFSVRVKSAMLQDLKYEQHQNPNDNVIWGY